MYWLLGLSIVLNFGLTCAFGYWLWRTENLQRDKFDSLLKWRREETKELLNRIQAPKDMAVQSMSEDLPPGPPTSTCRR